MANDFSAIVAVLMIIVLVIGIWFFNEFYFLK